MFDFIRKLLPIQPDIAASESGQGYPATDQKVIDAIDTVGIINRCAEVITAAAAEVPIKIYKYDEKKELIEAPDGKLARFLRHPNKHYDANQFYSKLIIDLILDGNAFIFISNSGMYHAPAKFMEIIEDATNYISGYRYIANGKQKIYPRNSVIHIRTNNSQSVYRGVGRLSSLSKEILIYKAMLDFQHTFFLNSGMPKTILKTDNFLNRKMKAKLLQEWKEANSVLHQKGNGTAILDGGLSMDTIVSSFKDIDFSEGVARLEEHIATALGVPWVLLNSGNNANIRNNQRLLYYHTVIPFMDKIAAAIQNHLYRVSPKMEDRLVVKADHNNVEALRPDLKEQSNFLSTLVNGGIISPNEARRKLRMDPMDGHDEIRIPANIAGSAVNPDTGGKPANDGEE